MNLRKRALRHLGAVAAVCMLVSACSPGSAPPPAAPPGTPAAPSTAAATPRETQLERQQRLDFEAAEKSYRAFNAEYDRLASLGGVDRASEQMKKYAAGPYLKSMVEFLARTKSSGLRQRGAIRVAYIHPGFYSDSKLQFDTCEDGTRVLNVNKKGKVVGKGLTARVSVEARRVKGVWKLWDGDDEQVKTCAP